MIQCRRGAGLVVRFRQKLQGDRALEPGVGRAIHDAHSATAEALLDSVIGYGLTDHVCLKGPRDQIERGRLEKIVRPAHAAAIPWLDANRDAPFREKPSTPQRSPRRSARKTT